MQEEILRRIEYDPEKGKFFSRIKTSNHDVGDEVKGSVTRKGYIKISVNDKLYFAHRLAFLCMGVELPEQVDHANGIKTDNKWSNLRPATQGQNQLNTEKRITNTSGYKNVYWRPERGHWQVRIKTKDGTKYIGSFTDVEEANFAAIDARKTYQKEWCVDVR